jgi:hypothetical protein
MVDLESVLFNSINMADIRHSESNTVLAGLVEATKNITECALLVICRHTAAKEPYDLGVFLTRRQIVGPCIQSGESSFDETAYEYRKPALSFVRSLTGIERLNLSVTRRGEVTI